MVTRDQVQSGRQDGYLVIDDVLSATELEKLGSAFAPFKVLFDEEGGRFTDLAVRPTIYSGNALASSGRLHGEALALLKDTSV